jgi:CxxC-x17-CxxC domain-containing protein
MTFQDKSLQCSDCGVTFDFTATEQEFYHSKGFTNEPKRCPECRRARKSEQRGGGYGSRRDMFPAVCAECGKDTEVPFRPTGERPVYCSDCFRKTRPERY